MPSIATLRDARSWKEPSSMPSPSRSRSSRSEEHTSELQSPCNLVCRLLLEKKHSRANRRLFCSRCVTVSVGLVNGRESTAAEFDSPGPGAKIDSAKDVLIGIILAHQVVPHN